MPMPHRSGEDGAIPGLGLGGEGLALKMILLQVVGVNLQVAVLARRGDVGHAYGYQAAVPALLLGASWGSRWVAEWVIAPVSQSPAGVAAVALGVVLYVLVSGILVWRRPDLAGLTRELRQVIAGSVASRPQPCRS